MNLVDRIKSYFSNQPVDKQANVIEVLNQVKVIDNDALKNTDTLSGFTPTAVYIDECNDVTPEQTEALRSLQEADKGVFESFNNGLCPETYPTQVKHYSSVNNKLTFVGYITKQQDIK